MYNLFKKMFVFHRQIKADCCGLVFGVNTFLALAFQTLLTLFVVELGGLEPQTQVSTYLNSPFLLRWIE